MSYEYCVEKMSGGGFFGAYRKSDDGKCEEFIPEKNAWKHTNNAEDAFNGEMFTMRISEEELVPELQKRVAFCKKA